MSLHLDAGSAAVGVSVEEGGGVCWVWDDRGVAQMRALQNSALLRAQVPEQPLAQT